MITYRYHVLAIILLVIALTVFYRRVNSSDNESSEQAESGMVPRLFAVSSDHLNHSDGRVITKGKNRGKQRKPTQEETVALVIGTVLPRVDLPEQTLADRVKELNRLLRDCGIESGQLSVVVDEEGPLPDSPLPGLFCHELRVRNLPFDQLLKYMADNTKLRYGVDGGRVELFFAGSLRDQQRRKDKVGETVEMEETVEDDVVVMPGAADPFAEAEKE